ncbi:gap junction delta-3 protein [Labrus bergylta]|uniref:gap junction delta-3 protein n=1 Tax=Labrus bergylta TaxID=56723 RepID=UPI0009B4AE1A|nr:gap junction delta-3 protein [Labrus bergylta]XP_029136513.1 gap junction delta-3 protein [Labrus bergylta]
MGEWGFLGGLFDSLQAHSPMLGRFWLLIMLVFRILILGTVASDLFEDEQEEFACNTLQPGCKQVCYDMAFPISQYRFWVFHIVLIATPSLLFLMYAMHHDNKRKNTSKVHQSDSSDSREDLHFRRFYVVNVAFRILAEVGFLVGQWYLYGFKVEAQFPCNRFPCPYTVDCFTSRPAEKTVFLCFYFVVGVIAAISSCAELLYGSMKWFCSNHPAHDRERYYVCEHQQNSKLCEAGADEKPQGKAMSARLPNSVKLKAGSLRSSTSRKVSSIGHKPKGKYVSTKTLMV